MRSTQKVIALAIISMAFRILCTHCIQSLHFTQDCIVLVSIYWHGMFLRAEGAPGHIFYSQFTYYFECLESNGIERFNGKITGNLI